MKEEAKTSSGSATKSRNKQDEEPMEWDVDTKDVLRQLLRDDVTYLCHFD